MKTISTIFLMLGASSVLAYLPDNWTPEHASSDFQSADEIVVARVVGLNRTVVTNQSHRSVEFHASFVVVRPVRGLLTRQDSFSYLIGQDTVGFPPDEEIVRLGLLLHGTQQSYHFDINGVYLLCLSKTERGWEPRSGPYSVFRIQNETKETEPSRLLVDPKSNRAEAHEHVTRQVREFSGVVLEKFLNEKLMKRDTQP